MPPITGIGTVAQLGLLTSTDLSVAHQAATKPIRVSKCNIQVLHGEEMDAASFYSAPEEAHLGPVDVKVDLEFPVWGQSLQHILLAHMGQVTASGAGDPYTNTYDHLDVPTYTAVAARVLKGGALSLERQIGNSADAEKVNFTPTRIEVSGGRNKVTMARVQGIGGKYTISTKTGSLSLPTENPLPGAHGTVFTINAVANLLLKDWRWFSDRHNSTDEYDGNSRTRRYATYNEIESGFECTVEYQSKTQLQTFLDSASATSWSDTAGKANTYACDIKTTGTTPGANTRSLQWTSGKVFLQAGDVVHEANKPYTQKLRGRALHNGTRAFQVVELSGVDASTLL